MKRPFSAINNSYILITNPGWIFNQSVAKEPSLWPVIEHVIFRNQRNHKALAFAVDYIVVETLIEDLLPNKQIVRSILCYGEHLGIMINSIHLFTESYPGCKLLSCKQEEIIFEASLSSRINKLLNQNMVGSVHLFRYIPPFHKTQTGSWEQEHL